MAGVTINDLTAMSASDLTANDELAVWDAEAGTGVEPTKKITAENLAAGLIGISNLVITDQVVMDFSTSTTVTEDVPQHTGYKPLCVVGTAFSGGYNPAQVTTAYLTDTRVRCCSSDTTSLACTVTIAYIRSQ